MTTADIPVLGIDVAGDNQPCRLMRYPDWAALGFRYGWVEYLRAGWPVPDAAAHRNAMRQAGLATAGYFNVGPSDGAAQARDFLAASEPGELPDLVDLEQGGVTASIALDAAHTLVDAGRKIVPYGNYNTFLRILPNLADRQELARISAGIVIGSYPFDAPGEDQPMDAASVARRSTPPAQPWLFAIPAPWTMADLFSFQHTGHGSLPGYGGFLDLHVAGLAFAAPTLVERVAGLVSLAQRISDALSG